MATLEDYLAQNDGGHMLDIACGSGNFTKRLVTHLKSYTSIIGLDIKANEEDFLKNVAAPHVTFVRSSISDFLKNPQTFDTISISNALHHLENVQDTLSKFTQLCHTNTTLIINEMYSDRLTPAQEVQRDLHTFMADLHRQAGEYHRGPFSTDEIHTMIETAGFLIHHSFESKNDGPPSQIGQETANSRSVTRIQTAIEHAYPQNPPQEILDKYEHLKSRAAQTGIGTPPQITFICTQKSI